MINAFEDVQKLSKDNVDVALRSAEAVSKGIQEIGAESTEFTKKSIEASASVFETLLTAKSLEKVLDVQSEFVRTSYEGYVGQAAKVGEICAEMAKNAYKPYESFLGKIGS